MGRFRKQRKIILYDEDDDDDAPGMIKQVKWAIAHQPYFHIGYNNFTVYNYVLPKQIQLFIKQG